MGASQKAPPYLRNVLESQGKWRPTDDLNAVHRVTRTVHHLNACGAMVGDAGFELATLRSQTGCSDQTELIPNDGGLGWIRTGDAAFEARRFIR